MKVTKSQSFPALQLIQISISCSTRLSKRQREKTKMKIDTLESLKDDELRSVIDRSNELLEQRDRQRKEKALGEARALLESVGLSLKDVAAGKAQKNGNGKGAVYHAGHQYQH